MNLVILIFSLSGGAGRVAVNLTKALNNRGHSVQIMCGKADACLLSEVGSSYKIIPSKNFLQFIFRLSITNLFSGDRIYFAFDPLLGAVVSLMSSVKSKKREVIAWRILTATEHAISGGGLKSFIKKRLIQVGSKSCDLIVANSQGTKTSFLKVNPEFPERKVKVIYNPVDIRKSTPSVKQLDLRRELNIPSDSLLIVSAGRLTFQKGFDNLIKSYSLAKERVCQRSCLVIFGNGKLYDELKAQISLLGLHDCVFLYGHVDNIRTYISQADLFVLSSRYEGFGNVIVEALSEGVNVVSTNCVSGPSEILENGKFGKLVPVDDPEALAEAMCNSLAGNKLPESKLIKRAREFSVDLVSLEYERQLSELCPKILKL